MDSSSKNNIFMLLDHLSTINIKNFMLCCRDLYGHVDCKRSFADARNYIWLPDNYPPNGFPPGIFPTIHQKKFPPRNMAQSRYSTPQLISSSGNRSRYVPPILSRYGTPKKSFPGIILQLF